jgi:tetratricopeptide (TPR) repeat protein
MAPGARLVAALATLGVFAWILTPRAVVTAREPGPTTETLLAVSRDALTRQQWNQALEPTRALVERFPSQHVYLERLAQIYHALARYSDEAETWERVLTVAPNTEYVCPDIGSAYEKAGNLTAAVDAFQRCVKLDPRNPESLYYLARTYQRADQSSAAERAYRDVLTLEPTHVDGAVGLAALRLRDNAPGEALALVEPILRRFPDNADLLLVAGLSYHRLDRRDEARHAIARGLELEDAYPDLHIAMGIIDFGDGRRREARTHFERAVTLEPSRRPEVQVWLDRTRDAG